VTLDYRISKLLIRNFRGIDEFETQFPKNSPTYLIGSNNACKSTILNAISLSLKAANFYQFSPSEYDFYHAIDGTSEKDFTIELHFEANAQNQLPAVRGGVGDPIPVHGIRTIGRAKNGSFTHSHRLFDENHDDILITTRVPLKGEHKIEYKDQKLNTAKTYARLEEIRQHLPDVWLLSPDNLYASLYKWETGPLKRLAKFLTKEFFEKNWEFEREGKVRPMPQTLKNVYNFFFDVVAAFPLWRDNLKPNFELTFAKYLGRSSKVALNPNIQHLEHWLAQQLALSFASDANGALTPLECMGQGWQALVRIAALDVLSQYPDLTKDRIFLLYEEPETYLHPHLCNKLRKILSFLSESGWYVLSTTHAPQFLSFSSNQKVIRLWRKNNKVIKGEIETSQASQEVRFQEKLDEKGTHEMLFAQKIILCEGKDDIFAIRYYLEKSEVDIDAEGITFVDTGGKNNLPKYADIAGKLNINWCAVTDEDKKDDLVDASTEGVRNKLEKLKTGKDLTIIWHGNLEASLNLQTGKADPEWQLKNINLKNLYDLIKTYPLYSGTCEKIKDWAAS